MINFGNSLWPVIDFLKDIGEYENSIIIFLSDNGANPKGIAISPDFSSDHTLFVSTRKAGLFQKSC